MTGPAQSVRRPGWGAPWSVWLIIIIAAGILSRSVRTGFLLWDKYLGDALYAAMIYGMLRLRWKPSVAAVWATGALIAIELFQLTSIAARMLRSESLLVRIIARLMGTHFSYWDLLAYFVAIGCVYLLDVRKTPRAPAGRKSP